MAGIVIPTSLPEFTYSNTNYSANLVDGWGWVLRFASSGTLKFTEDQIIDVSLLGGGGGGGGSDASVGGGGGGGYQTFAYGIHVPAGTEWQIIVGGYGKGSYTGGQGGTSSAFGYSASGGYGGKHGDSKSTYASGGAGGTGNGGSRSSPNGGSNTVREFGETDISWPLYGGGGAAGSGTGGSPYGGHKYSVARGYGGGGGGENNGDEHKDKGKNGYQGLVSIRNSANNIYPIIFNDSNAINSFEYQGKTITSMSFNSKTLF